MATNLTPEQLAQLQRLFNTPQGSGDGNAYMPENVFFNGRNYDKQDSGYLGYDLAANDFSKAGNESAFNGQSYDQYGNDGSFTNSGQFTGIEDSNKALDFIKAAAMMAGPFAAGMSPAVNGAMSFGTNPVIGAVGGGGGMVNGAFLGEAPWSATGGGALDFGAGTSAMGAGAGGAGGGIGTMAPMELLPSTMGEYALPGAMSAGGGLLSGIGGKALGLGATALGGVLGSQGQKAEQSSTRDIPEWLKPYAQKVLGYGGTLLDAQMQPGAMAGFDQMKTQGQSLLSQPIAGNGTSLFQPRPTLMRR